MDAYFNSLRPNIAGSYNLEGSNGASIPDSLDDAYSKGALTGDQVALLNPLLTGAEDNPYFQSKRTATLTSEQANALFRSFPQIQANLAKSGLPGRIDIYPNYSASDVVSSTGTPQLSNSDIAKADAKEQEKLVKQASEKAAQGFKWLLGSLGETDLFGVKVPIIAIVGAFGVAAFVIAVR